MKKLKAVRFNKVVGAWTREKARAALCAMGFAEAPIETLTEEATEWIFERGAVPMGAATLDNPGEGASVEYEEEFSDPVDESLADAALEAVENPIGILDPRLLALLMDRAVKITDQEFQIRKGYESEVQKDTGNNGRIRMRMTTDREDRMGDVIEINGWVFDNYQRNPIILFNHEYGEVGGSPPSQGRSLAITSRKKSVDNDIEFHRKTRFNEELYAMYGGGFMKTGSVGFWPLAKPEERKTADGGVGLKFTKQDLLEFSLVAVPANPDAYQLAMKKGLVRPKAVEYLVSSMLSFAAGPDKGKTVQPTAAPDRTSERTSSARLAAALVLMRAKFHNKTRGL